MRIWLNPEKVAERGMTAGDIVAAIRRQNVQVSAGVINGPPYSANGALQLPINAQGRLTDVEEFSEIIVKREGGVVTRLKDVARVEIDASQYGLRSLLNGKQAVAIPIFQAPRVERDQDLRRRARRDAGPQERISRKASITASSTIRPFSSAIRSRPGRRDIVHRDRARRSRRRRFPADVARLDHSAPGLVPVSIVGTFAVMHMFGFSINALSLFGLVLAIGIVVDDSIVVVENVERNIENGLSPRDATLKAMREVTRARSSRSRSSSAPSSCPSRSSAG